MSTSSAESMPILAGEFVMFTSPYGKVKATISGHIKNVFEEGELNEDSVVRFYRTTEHQQLSGY